MRTPSPLTQLRKAAPGSLTGLKLEAFFKKRRFPRSFQTILNFERGQHREPPDRFLEVYAEAIGQPIDTVRRALRRTLRERTAGTGSFARKRVGRTRNLATGNNTLD